METKSSLAPLTQHTYFILQHTMYAVHLPHVKWPLDCMVTTEDTLL